MSHNDFVASLFRRIKRGVSSKGRRNEFRTTAAFEGSFADVPEWLLDIYNADEAQDPEGVDVIVVTDQGDIRVQIKSNSKKAAAFKLAQDEGRYGKDIVVIVLKEDFDPKMVRAAVISGILGEYEKRCKESARIALSKAIQLPS